MRNIADGLLWTSLLLQLCCLDAQLSVNSLNPFTFHFAKALVYDTNA